MNNFAGTGFIKLTPCSTEGKEPPAPFRVPTYVRIDSILEIRRFTNHTHVNYNLWDTENTQFAFNWVTETPDEIFDLIRADKEYSHG